MTLNSRLFYLFIYGIQPLTGWTQDENANHPKRECPIKIAVINEDNSIEFSSTISPDGKTLIFEYDRIDENWMLFMTT